VQSARSLLELTLVCLLVTVSSLPAETHHVAPGGDDGGAGTEAQPWATIRHAADSVIPGDTVLIHPGTYSEAVHMTTSATEALPIIFRASAPGVVIDGAALPTDFAHRDLFFIEHADWVTVESLTLQDAHRAGVRLSYANHVTIRGCLCADSGTWGIFTDFSDDTLLEGNDCRGSVAEHGIYVSNSSDRAVIRGNHCHDNNASGIQINADPQFLDPGDGISSNCLVENNICHDNGTAGGAAINLASVRDSVIRNNLLWGNRAGGIAGWGDGNGPAWGTMDNQFYHNTVWFRPTEGRWCISLKEGSVRNTIRDNILFGGHRGAIEFDDSSFVGWVADHNLLRRDGSAQIATNESTDAAFTLAQWQALGMGQGSIGDDPLFIDTATGDFRLQPTSPAIDRGVVIPGILTDLLGAPRLQGLAPDLGCYEFMSIEGLAGLVLF
jgi:hypothetical protein